MPITPGIWLATLMTAAAVLVSFGSQATAAPEPSHSGGDGVVTSSDVARSTSPPNRSFLNVTSDPITFSEFTTGTSVFDQYADRGILFGGDAPFITTDGSQPTSPVLSGSPKFFGRIDIIFTRPGSLETEPVLGFSADVGFINNRDSVEVAYFDRNGIQLGATTTNALGINRVAVSLRGIARVTIRAIRSETAGFSIDNVDVQRAALGIVPTRYASLGDSYSSGEGLIQGRDLRYDCGTDLFQGRYFDDTTVRRSFPVWQSGRDCRPSTGSRSRLSTRQLLQLPQKHYRNKCHRHARAYPNQIRLALNIPAEQSLLVACSGATTRNLGLSEDPTDAAYAQHADLSPFRVAGGETQAKNLGDFSDPAQGGRAPDLITIGIGGNDAGFATVVSDCITGDCINKSPAVAGLLATIYDVVSPRLKRTFAGLRRRYPDATIAVFGYPRVLNPEGDTCLGLRSPFDSISPAEALYLEQTVRPELNQAIAEAAAAAGLTYVDTSDATRGREICSDDPLVNGVEGGEEEAFGLVGSESFHPKPSGHDAIAKLFIDRYTDGAGRLVFKNPAPVESIEPEPSPLSIVIGSLDATPGSPCGAECVQPTVCVQGCTVDVAAQGLTPGATLQATLCVQGCGEAPALQRFGGPTALQALAPLTPLGTLQADAVGRVDARLTVPSAVPAGRYAVLLDGVGPDGLRQYAKGLLLVASATSRAARLPTQLSARAPRRARPTRRVRVAGHVRSGLRKATGVCVVQQRVGRSWRPVGRARLTKRQICGRQIRLRGMKRTVRVRVRYLGEGRYAASVSPPKAMRVSARGRR